MTYLVWIISAFVAVLVGLFAVSCVDHHDKKPKGRKS